VNEPRLGLRLDTLDGCRLAIGRYPGFRYDGRGGGGAGWGQAGGGPLVFTGEELTIPALDHRTTRLLGMPLPPGLAITINARELQGCWSPDSGTISLRFDARFRFRIGPERAPLYVAPDLLVVCELSSGAVSGRRHRGEGRAMDDEGFTRLVGVATVPPSGDAWLDRFLGLPDEALAVLQCQLRVIPD
jgi:hypothetical protein